MFVVGVCYLFRFLNIYKEKLSEKEFLLYYSVCTSLASKTHEDRFYGNSYYHYWVDWDKNHISLSQFSSIEMEILTKLDFNLFISHTELKNFISLHKIIKM